MTFDLKKWLPIGVKAVMHIPAALATIEGLKNAFKTGGDKEDAAVQLTKTLLETTEAVADRDLLDDPNVEAATRNVMKAIVALQNTIALAKQLKAKK